jgi:Raf kinase inhibitor-like YbhB/YbcL family protein
MWLFLAVFTQKERFMQNTSAAAMAKPGMLTVKLTGIEQGKPIPAKFAYGVPDGKGQSKDGANISPEISWQGAPPGTKSFAIIVVDKDVPQSFELANQPGKTIPNDFPRRDFYHWVLVDIPPTITHFSEGKDSSGVTKDGKPVGKREYGVTGHNDYSPNNGGYDGPCPPWNDERLHHYYFRVYALDVPTLGLKGSFGGKEAEAVIKGHVLAQGEVMGTYTQRA